MRVVLLALATALFAPAVHACAMLVWDEGQPLPLEQLLVQIDAAATPDAPDPSDLVVADPAPAVDPAAPAEAAEPSEPVEPAPPQS